MRQSLYILFPPLCVLSAIIGCTNLNMDAENGPMIETVVGSGNSGDNGDGRSALETSLSLPQDVTMGPDGNLYFPDWNNHKIRRVVDGKVETIAGSGEHDDNFGDDGDGYGKDISMNHPTNVEFDDQGRLLVAAWHNSVVKRIDLSTSYVETIAGTGKRAFSGDGGPGKKADLDLPSSVAFDSLTQTIYISDQANRRIRAYSEDGIIRTISGNGNNGYAGDNGPAINAEFNAPIGQAAAPANRLTINTAGEIFIADTGNHVIRQIDRAGIIRTIAGTGKAGYSGDGGPAIKAQFDTPSDVAIGPNGSIYVADTANNVIRVISPTGTIDTFAGTSTRGYLGDGGPAKKAQLDSPYGLTVDHATGDVYVADTYNQRIRRITKNQVSEQAPAIPEPDVAVVACTEIPGSICTFAGTGRKGFNHDGKSRLQSDLYWPIDLQFTDDGRTLVLDWNNHLVREIKTDGTLTTLVGTGFVGDGPKDLSDLTDPGADPITVNLNHPTDLVPLHEAILNPRAQVRDGYSNIMPKATLTDTEINEIVAYIKSLQ